MYKRQDDRRLNDGNERHITVRRHDDGTQILRVIVVREENRGRAISSADDADACGILDRKRSGQKRVHSAGKRKREENTELRRSTEQKQLRIRCV